MKTCALAIATLACLASCKPAEKDVAPLVDARLRELGLAPETSDAGTAGDVGRGDAGAKRADEDPVVSSLRFLAKLDALMEGYVPPVPPVDDGTEVLRCVTSRSLQKDTALKAAGQKLEAKRQAALKERQKRLRALFALSFRVDYDWASKKRTEPPVYGCCDEDGRNCERWPAGPQSCKFEGGIWRIIVPAGADRFVYTDTAEAPSLPPELMTRIERAHLPVPARFVCRVENVRTERMATLVAGKTSTDASTAQEVDFVVIDCASERGLDVVIRVAGDYAGPNGGDVVSVPLANVRRPEGVLLKTMGERELRWTLDAEASSVTIDRAAQCPTTDEILAAAKKK